MKKIFWKSLSVNPFNTRTCALHPDMSDTITRVCWFAAASACLIYFPDNSHCKIKKIAKWLINGSLCAPLYSAYFDIYSRWSLCWVSGIKLFTFSSDGSSFGGHGQVGHEVKCCFRWTIVNRLHWNNVIYLKYAILTYLPKCNTITYIDSIILTNPHTLEEQNAWPSTSGWLVWWRRRFLLSVGLAYLV